MIDRITDVWGARTPFAPGTPWPARVDQMLADGVAPEDVTWVRSACVLCSNGCGLDVAAHEGRIVGVRGHADDRVNRGRLGPKGLFGWQANNAADRLTTPLVRVDGQLEPATWADAMDLVVGRSRSVLDEHGPLAMGFYDSGQLFLEDYYTLAVIVRAGIGTPHLDANTRLCTATADAALKETFGTDGDPGCIEDLDLCDTFLAVGYNAAETNTVLWMRLLDRLAGSSPPRIVAVDPRRTPVAEAATVHLPVLPGTNLPLLNAIQHELIANDAVDAEFVNAHTVGYDTLVEVVSGYDPDRVARICGVPAADIRLAARIIGESERMVSACLQGVYQSHQATASACQVNNITLLRGMIGKPGCTVFQMNGQPTAQNARETGADGDLMGNRNWQNLAHVAELAGLWDVDPLAIPSWSPPTHAMQLFRLAEEGSIRFLWVVGTNPAVSLPDLRRIRAILSQERLFVVVSDAFITETAALADVVLPVALWGEKTGTFTNHDRTCHLSMQAVDPPGEARPDLQILLDYAARMELTNRSGGPLIAWQTPEECFEAFKRATAGRPCDYSGMTYGRLQKGPLQWPCNREHPDGAARLYTDHVFNTDTDYCEDWGHNLVTGTPHERKDHLSLGADGRAVLKAAHHLPPHEAVSTDHPLVLTTGRTVYQFHTRTKTGRTPQLDAAAPEVWAELHPADAELLEIADGDLVAIESVRGRLEARARLTGTRAGVVFVPFHYGYWDERHDGAEPDQPTRAANELTITDWDPVSKQPAVKVAAVRVSKVAARELLDTDAVPTRSEEVA